MTQVHPDLFDTARMYRRAGTSSTAAFKAAKSARINDTHRRIWEALKIRPRTPDEIAADLKMERNTARARISELRAAGWAQATGETRLTAAGKPAEVMSAKHRDGGAL